MWLEFDGRLLDDAAVACVVPNLMDRGMPDLDFVRLVLHSGHQLEARGPVARALHAHFAAHAVPLLPQDEADELLLEHRRRSGKIGRSEFRALFSERQRIYREAGDSHPTGMAKARLYEIEKALLL